MMYWNEVSCLRVIYHYFPERTEGSCVSQYSLVSGQICILGPPEYKAG
jgi:hypothetical protein